MDDLSSDKEFDWHEYEYHALTEKTVIMHRYDFSNFEELEFKAEKRFLNIPDIEALPCKVDSLKREVYVEAGNLKNGDRIVILYKKKPQ